MWLYFLGIAKTSCSSFILPQEAFFFHCLLLLERFTTGGLLFSLSTFTGAVHFTLAFGVLYIYAEIRKAFYWNAQPQKELLRSMGLGASTNKYRLAKWIARRIACWNIWYQQALLATTTFAFEHLQPVSDAALKLKPQLKIC